MRTLLTKPQRLGMLLLFVLGLSACSQGATAPELTPSSHVLAPAINPYYPVDATSRIRYSYPTRPFDVDMTLEGIGWQEGKLVVVMKAQVNNQKDIFSHASKMLTPTITYKGMTIKLKEIVWEEGASGVYKDSVYRFAVSAPETSQIPVGASLESVTVLGVPIKLPEQLPAATTLPEKKTLLVKVGESSKMIDSGPVTYRVERVEIGEEEGKIGLLVRAAEEESETSRFLLRDDLGRIYTCDPYSVPKEYKQGDNHIVLRFTQPVPSDAKHLSLIMFESNLQQLDQYNITGEAEIPLF